MTFQELGLSEEILSAVTELGFVEPTPIQQEAIPHLLKDPSDLIGLASTGTGKTAAFGLPLINYIDPSTKSTQGLIICPTRELCIQISRDLETYSKNIRGLNVVSVYGGTDIMKQIRQIEKGAHIIVATPGRLMDLINRRKIKLNEVDTVILDEADEMLNMGFKEDIDSILQKTPEDKCVWLF
jgi:ATP-dependent RNA helicase DeaD